MALTQLEENNLKAQIKLLDEMVINYSTMINEIAYKGESVRLLLLNSKTEGDNRIIEDKKFNEVYDFLSKLDTERQRKSISSISGTAIDTNIVIRETLVILKKK